MRETAEDEDEEKVRERTKTADFIHTSPKS